MPGSLAKLGVELRQGRYFNNGDDGLETLLRLSQKASRSCIFQVNQPSVKR